MNRICGFYTRCNRENILKNLKQLYFAFSILCVTVILFTLVIAEGIMLGSEDLNKTEKVALLFLFIVIFTTIFFTPLIYYIIVKNKIIWGFVIANFLHIVIQVLLLLSMIT